MLRKRWKTADDRAEHLKNTGLRMNLPVRQQFPLKIWLGGVKRCYSLEVVLSVLS